MSYCIIVGSVPSGPESQELCERLSQELGQWSFVIGGGRRAVLDLTARRWGRLNQDQQMDLVSVLVPAEMADEVFALACSVLRVSEPGRGFVFRQPVSKAIPLTVPVDKNSPLAP